MSEDLALERSLFPERQLKLAPVEVQDRVIKDEQKIIHEEYTGGLAVSTIEEALTAAFRDRVEHRLGSYPLPDAEVDQEDLDFLAQTEGLGGGSFTKVREIGALVVRRRVALIARRKGLDLTLAQGEEDESLRKALIQKHTEEVERERA